MGAADHNTLLAETIARHFPGAHVSSEGIDLAFGGLRLECWVDSVTEVGRYRAAHLFFNLSGGVLGPSPVFASISGYDELAERAIIVGACNWASSFGPVLRAGLAGEGQPNVDAFDVVLDGRPYRVFVDGVDRAVSFSDEADLTGRTRATRERLGALPWMTRAIVASELLPLLPTARPTLLSAFVFDGPQKRVLEVKVNGQDWPLKPPRFVEAAPEPAGGMSLLRELAVLVPQGAAPALSRPSIRRTLDGLALEVRGARRHAVSWPGWQAHGGRLADPLTPGELATLEDELGPLPDDYRAFLRNVAESGAGPGYGLKPAGGREQRSLSRGRFAWSDGEDPEAPPAGVIALAHAGCGVMWLLVLEGEHRGEVWVDAGGSDGHVRRVAASFDAWYRDWLDAAVRDASPWCQWDADCCATPGVLAQVVDHVEKEGHHGEAARARIGELKLTVTLTSGGSAYFAPQAALDPCHACVALVQSFGLAERDVFRQPPDAAPASSGDRRGGLAARVRRLLRRRR